MVTIGKASALSGCKIETIRFYEKEGLIPPPQRTEGGHRLYPPAATDRLIFIRRCRELGFAMVDIRQLLSLVDGQEVTCERVKRIVDAHLSETREKIADLRKMENILCDLSESCGGGDVPDCPIIEALQPAAINAGRCNCSTKPRR